MYISPSERQTMVHCSVEVFITFLLVANFINAKTYYHSIKSCFLLANLLVMSDISLVCKWYYCASQATVQLL